MVTGVIKEDAPSTESAAIPQYATMLIEAREKSGMDQRAIATMLRIRLLYIDALEKGEVDVLPGDAYAIGFLHSYARAMKLDVDQVTHLFREHIGKDSVSGRVNLQKQGDRSNTSTDKLLFFVLAIAGVVVLGLFINILFSDRDDDATLNLNANPNAPASVAPEPSALPSALPSNDTLASDAAGAAGNTTSAAAPAPDRAAFGDGSDQNIANAVVAQRLLSSLPSGSVIISSNEQSWIEIRDSTGTVILSRVFQPDETYIVPSRDDLLLTTGNAPGLVLHYGVGEWRALAAPEGNSVVRKVPLTAEALREFFARVP